MESSYNNSDRQRNCFEKLTWTTENDARAAIAYAAWQYGSQQSKPRPYRCKYCNKWHLASA